MIPTTQRVEANTPDAINRQTGQQARETFSRYADASPQQIDQRLRELDREWNTERIIETEAPLTVALGAVLGLVHDRRWFALSATAAGMLLLHNLQGWYPLLPVLRRLGVRSQNEIEQERSALRALRSGHATRH
ncbi:MAG TPA: hypothetical protein VJ603_09555 [Paucimonas sp.]|nr:hypothetical protein [Paucimonas sp.]HJW57176.1 hypothetical protein [Burkholderiaceae bacterium]